jgi:hypothetical protein
MVEGRKAGTDVNLYKLFSERCFRLLRAGGRCGILVPTSIYSDLGAKGLREMLFSQARVEVLFGFSNERFLFEGVDHRFRICVLVFERGGMTESFTAAFRMDPREAVSPDRLEAFLETPSEHIELSWDLVKRLSPSSASVTELKNASEIEILEKMYRFPLLGGEAEGSWRLRFGSEFHMTNDSAVFNSVSDAEMLPLYEGKMIHQFDCRWGWPRYWVRHCWDVKKTRVKLLIMKATA